MLNTHYASTQIVALDGCDKAQHWTTSEAAAILSIPERRVRRLLQREVLSGFKVRGRFGDEWRIHSFDPKKIKALLSLPDSSSAPGTVGDQFCADPAALDNMHDDFAASEQFIAEPLNATSNSSLYSIEERAKVSSDNFLQAAYNSIKMRISTMMKGKNSGAKDCAPMA